MVRPAYGVGMFQIGDVHPGPDDVFHRRSGLLECPFDDVEGVHGLTVGVAGGQEGSGGVGADGSGDMDGVAHTDRAGVTDLLFPWAPAADVSSFHRQSVHCSNA